MTNSIANISEHDTIDEDLEDYEQQSAAFRNEFFDWLTDWIRQTWESSTVQRLHVDSGFSPFGVDAATMLCLAGVIAVEAADAMPSSAVRMEIFDESGNIVFELRANFGHSTERRRPQA